MLYCLSFIIYIHKAELIYLFTCEPIQLSMTDYNSCHRTSYPLHFFLMEGQGCTYHVGTTINYLQALVSQLLLRTNRTLHNHLYYYWYITFDVMRFRTNRIYSIWVSLSFFWRIPSLLSFFSWLASDV